MKPTKCPAREKKNEARKAKKEGRRNLKILLSARARTSQADVLHLAQKAAKCTTCKTVCAVIPSVNRASITSEYIEI